LSSSKPLFYNCPRWQNANPNIGTMRIELDAQVIRPSLSGFVSFEISDGHFCCAKPPRQKVRLTQNCIDKV
jgi:hypothetical protein